MRNRHGNLHCVHSVNIGSTVSGARLLQRQISPCLKNLDKRLHCAGGSVIQKAMLSLAVAVPATPRAAWQLCVRGPPRAEGLYAPRWGTLLDGGRTLCPGGIRGPLCLYSCLNVK